MTDNNNRKDLQSKADRILERVKAAQQTAGETLDVARNTAEQLSYVGKVVKGIGKGFSWVNDRVIDPVMTVLPFLKPVWHGLRDGYTWFCCPAEPFAKAVGRIVKNAAGSAGNAVLNIGRSEKKPFAPDYLPPGKFSKSRAGIAVLATMFAASPIAEKIPLAGQYVPDVISDHAYGLLYEPPYDAVRMGVTALFNKGHLERETIYLNGKNEIEPANDVWSVGGCETKPDCSSDEAVTFHIKPSLMHHAWSLATGRGPFLADYVAVPIPNVPSKCEVISYGMRWRLSKWLNSYPVLLDAHCESLPQSAPAAPGL